MKKLVFAVLLLCLFLCAAPLLVACNHTEKPPQDSQKEPNTPLQASEGLQFSPVNANGYKVSGVGSCTDSVIVVPGTYEGKPVISLGTEAFKQNQQLTGIVLPESLKSIGRGAFSGCKKLKEILLPDAVETIGKQAFKGCTGLKSITMGTGLRSVGEDAFGGCTYLSKVCIPDIAKWSAVEFHDKSANPLFYAHNLYIDGEPITDLTLPEHTESIGRFAFSGFTNLKTLVIPSSVTDIGLGAFSDCSNLTSITLPFLGKSPDLLQNAHFGFIFGAETAEASSQSVPASLTAVTITGDKQITLREHAFANCTSVANITLSDNVTYIGDYAFAGCTALATVTIPGTVTAIGSNVFSGCTSLATITIPDTVTVIGSSVLSDCTGLSALTVPFLGETSTDEKNAFLGYFFGATNYKNNQNIPESLKSVTITGGKTLGDGAFYHCANLTEIVLAASTESIGESAFSGCTGITGISIPQTHR